MKIGILTFHCAHNYGAVLQAYALQEHLCSLGHEVYIIDYRPNYLVEPYKVFSWKRIPKGLLGIKVLLGECVRLPRYIKRYRSFNSFISKNMHLLPSDFQNAEWNMDVFVFGSDQIWNKSICGDRFDLMYLGAFKAAEHKKKIAYAASAGQTNDFLPVLYYLHKFSAISVRETSLCNVLATEANLEVSTVLDPTLLVDVGAFEKILKKPNVPQKYVLVYQVYLSDETNRKVIKIAEDIATQIGGVVIDLSFQMSLRARYCRSASPEEFLGYIKYADCVVTNSFHGTAFSIILEKSFYTVKVNSSIDLRAYSLLKKLSLEERFIEQSTTHLFSKIDYAAYREAISLLRMDSREFIDKNL